MMQAATYGRLGQDPRSIETKNGKPMAVASLAVDVADSRNGEDQQPEWFGIVAFGKRADDLLRHGKGDLVSVSGRVQRNSYTTREGEQREQLQIVADAIVSAKTVRPKGGRKRTEKATERGEAAPAPQGHETASTPASESKLNDPLPF